MISHPKIALDLSGPMKWAWSRNSVRDYLYPVSLICIADFPTLFKTEFRFLIPCLRHLMCLVSMPKSTEFNIN